MSVVPTAAYRCSANPIQTPVQLHRITPRHLRIREGAQSTQGRESDCEGGRVKLGFQVYWEVTVGQDNTPLKAGTWMDGADRMAISPHGCGQLLWRKDSLSNKLCCQSWICLCRKRKLDPYLSQWKNQLNIKSLYLRSGTVEIFEENIEGTTENNVGDDLLVRPLTEVAVVRWNYCDCGKQQRCT